MSIQLTADLDFVVDGIRIEEDVALHGAFYLNTSDVMSAEETAIRRAACFCLNPPETTGLIWRLKMYGTVTDARLTESELLKCEAEFPGFIHNIHERIH